MDTVTLLAELRALAAGPPDFAGYVPTSRAHLEWLGKTYALRLRWDKYEAMSFKTACDLLPLQLTRDAHIGTIHNVLHRAIADLELKVGALPAQAFGPGAVYDFMKALRDLLASATTSLFVIDPYLDEQVFDTYLSTLSPAVSARLLARDSAKSLRASVAAFVVQKRMSVEIRTSQATHDRVIFLDDRSCWVLGQSLKDAAKSKPTYLAPLPNDVAQLKKADYERIWASAIPL